MSEHRTSSDPLSCDAADVTLCTIKGVVALDNVLSLHSCSPPGCWRKRIAFTVVRFSLVHSLLTMGTTVALNDARLTLQDCPSAAWFAFQNPGDQTSAACRGHDIVPLVWKAFSPQRSDNAAGKEQITWNATELASENPQMLSGGRNSSAWQFRAHWP